MKLFSVGPQLPGLQSHQSLLAMGCAVFSGCARLLLGLSGIIGKLDRLWHYSRRARLAIRVCLLWAEVIWVFLCVPDALSLWH